MIRIEIDPADVVEMFAAPGFAEAWRMLVGYSAHAQIRRMDPSTIKLPVHDFPWLNPHSTPETRFFGAPDPAWVGWRISIDNETVVSVPVNATREVVVDSLRDYLDEQPRTFEAIPFVHDGNVEDIALRRFSLCLEDARPARLVPPSTALYKRLSELGTVNLRIIEVYDAAVGKPLRMTLPLDAAMTDVMHDYARAYAVDLHLEPVNATGSPVGERFDIRLPPEE